MSLPRDFDITKVSDTYLQALLSDQDKQDAECARQVNEIQVRRATIADVRSQLQAELDRRKPRFPIGTSVRHTPSNDTGIIIGNTVSWYEVQSVLYKAPMWWNPECTIALD